MDKVILTVTVQKFGKTGNLEKTTTVESTVSENLLKGVAIVAGVAAAVTSIIDGKKIKK